MSDLKIITDLARKQLALEKEIELKELELKDLKTKLNQVKCIDLPEYMLSIDFEHFRLADGSSVTIKRDLRAYIREEDKYSVYSWLKKNNYGSIIKANIIASFGSNEYQLAEKIHEQLMKEGIKAIKKEDIHWMTFNKFAKECLEEGIELHENIQIQPLTEAKIK